LKRIKEGGKRRLSRKLLLYHHKLLQTVIQADITTDIMSTVLRESILSGPCTKDEERFERTADLADGKDEKS